MATSSTRLIRTGRLSCARAEASGRSRTARTSDRRTGGTPGGVGAGGCGARPGRCAMRLHPPLPRSSWMVGKLGAFVRSPSMRALLSAFGLLVIAASPARDAAGSEAELRAAVVRRYAALARELYAETEA